MYVWEDGWKFLAQSRGDSKKTILMFSQILGNNLDQFPTYSLFE